MDEIATNKIRIKIGSAEFEAEGPVDIVNEQFTQFMAVVKATEPSPPPSAQLPMPPSTSANTSSKANGSEISDQLQNAPNLASGVLNRVFRKDGDGLSLLALPRTDDAEADALIVLLYGFSVLTNKQHVTGVALMSSARQSGIQLQRVDRAINARDDLVLAAGNRRGRRYSLNNRGIRHAEQLIQEILT